MIGSGRLECSLSRLIIDTDEWTEVTWCISVLNFICQNSKFALYRLQNLQPVETDECISYMIAASPMVDQ